MAASGTSEKKLTPAQHKAIAALLTARDIPEAAKLAEVGERTLRRWLAEEPAFVAALDMAQREIMQAVVRRLSTLALASTGTLAAVMNSDDASASSKVRAAEVVLSQLMRLRELTELEQRLAAIETAQGKP